jgi:hypothetical protein
VKPLMRTSDLTWRDALVNSVYFCARNAPKLAPQR